LGYRGHVLQRGQIYPFSQVRKPLIKQEGPLVYSPYFLAKDQAIARGCLPLLVA